MKNDWRYFLSPKTKKELVYTSLTANISAIDKLSRGLGKLEIWTGNKKMRFSLKECSRYIWGKIIRNREILFEGEPSKVMETIRHSG